MLTLDFHKFPVIITERLVLRQLGIQDVVQIYKLRSNLKVNELTGRNISPSIEEAKEHITKITNLINNSECIQWGICLKETDTIIGTICFWNFDVNDEIAEIGYELLPEYHGNGIMTESMRHILQFGFEKMNIKIVTAFPSANNKSSVALLVKFGFVLDTKFYKNNHDHVINIVTYTFNRQNYFDSIANNAGSQHAI